MARRNIYLSMLLLLMVIAVLMEKAAQTAWAQYNHRHFKSAQIILPDGSKLRCAIANAPRLRSIGLSQITEYNQDTCMWFVYPKPQKVYFWMPPSMRFNLDIAFITAKGKVVRVSYGATPCGFDDPHKCIHYYANEPIRYVLEVMAGTAKRHGLIPGALVSPADRHILQIDR